MTREDRPRRRRKIIVLMAVTAIATGTLAIRTHRVHWNVEDVGRCARSPAVLVVDGISFSVAREGIRSTRPHRPQSCSPVEVDGFDIGPAIIGGQEDLADVSRVSSFPTVAAMSRNRGMRPPRPMSFARHEDRKDPDAESRPGSASGIIDMDAYSGTYRCWSYEASSRCHVVLYRRSRTGAVSIGRTWTTDPDAEYPETDPIRRTVELAEAIILDRE